MALPDSAKWVTGTPIVLADTTDHSPSTNNNLGTRTDQIDLTSLGFGAARQSDQIDFTANRDMRYVLAAVIEAGTAFVDAETIAFYMAWSDNATAAVGNPGGVTGSDSAYTGISGGSLATSLKQLDFLGVMTMDVVFTTNVNIDTDIATFVPAARYGTMVVLNQSAADNLVADAVEMSVVLTPQVLQVQD